MPSCAASRSTTSRCAFAYRAILSYCSEHSAAADGGEPVKLTASRVQLKERAS